MTSNPLKKPDHPNPEPADPLLDTPNRGAHWLQVVSCGFALYNLALVQHWINWPDSMPLFGGAITLTPTGASAVLNTVVGAVLTAAGVFAVKHFVDEDTVGAAHEKRTMQLAGLAGAAGTLWLIDAEGNPTRPMSAVMLVLWATIFGVLYVILRSKEPERKRQQRIQEQEKKREIEEYKLTREEALQLRTYRELWQPWLDECKIEARIISAHETDAGYTLTFGPGITDDNRRVYPSYTDLVNKLPALAARASEHYETQGTKLDSNAFKLEATDTAHKVLLHVSTRKFLEESHPHPGVEPPRSITAPIVTGVYEDGSPLKFEAVGNNGIMVGATNSGKSTYTHNYIAAWLASYDGEVWVAGMRKLMPLVGPWLDPWLLGLSSAPVIQRIAGEEPAEVLTLLADFYEAANEQNKLLLDDKRDITPDDPALSLIIDESSTVAAYKDKTVTTYDGRKWTAQELLSEICQICRSAGYNVFFLTQFGLVDALGSSYGTKTLRNVNLRIVGRTNSASDGRSILNAVKKVDSTTLRNNTLRVQTSQDVPRALPAKARDLRTREQIRDLAVAYTSRRHHLPAWLVQRFGETYTGRWNPERQPDLVARCKQLGVPYPTLTPEITGDYLMDVDTSIDTHRDAPAIGNAPEAEALPSGGVTSGLKAAMERLAEHQQNTKLRGEVIEVLRAEDAPEWVPATDLAVAAGLVDRDASDDDRRDAGQRLVDLFTSAPYHAVAEAQGAETGWPRDRLLDSIRAALESERAQTENTRPATTDPGEARKVLDALADVNDDWIRVGELGRLAGDVTADDPNQARKEAADFGRKLREVLGVPKTAFKAGREGTLVDVAGLRAALTGDETAS